jgi:tetratricopeptide (TPR) repeat protein
MGFRLQRRIRLGKFVQLNISKSGVGVSAGVRGFRLSTGPRGTQLNVGLPGTGLSYRKQLSSKRGKKKAKESRSRAQAASRQANLPDRPEPGLLASRAEKELARGLADYEAGHIDQALEHFLEAAPDEAGAAIFAAAILSKTEGQEFEASQLLEDVVQSDDEFPTELMQKYLPEAHLDIDITPNITASVPMDGLAATLLLVELYQTQRRVREAIALLEEIEELAGEPVLTLSLCELYASRNLWDNIIERAKDTESEDDVTLETLIFYGRAMQEKNLDEAAIAVFTKALRRKKDRNPILLHEARYWRAIIYQEQGKTQRANTEYQKLFAEAPDFRDVAERLADLSIK